MKDIVDQSKTQEIALYGTIVSEIVQAGMSINVNSIDKARQAINLISRCRDVVDQIESHKKAISEEARMVISTLNRATKQFCDQLDELETLLDQKLNNYTINHKIAKLCTDQASCVQKIDYVFDVEDISMVPSNLLSVDEKKVKALIKAGIETIPGITVRPVSKIEVRRAS